MAAGLTAAAVAPNAPQSPENLDPRALEFDLGPPEDDLEATVPLPPWFNVTDYFVVGGDDEAPGDELAAEAALKLARDLEGMKSVGVDYDDELLMEMVAFARVSGEDPVWGACSIRNLQY